MNYLILSLVINVILITIIVIYLWRGYREKVLEAAIDQMLFIVAMAYGKMDPFSIAKRIKRVEEYVGIETEENNSLSSEEPDAKKTRRGSKLKKIIKER